MSFLSSVLSSIETGNPSVLPSPVVRSPAPASNTSTSKPNSRKSTPPSIPSNKPINTTSLTGTKRKAEETLRRPEKTPSSASSVTGNGLKVRPKIPANESRPSPAKPTPLVTTSKPPIKGSFADLMAKAKAVQKEAPKVGVLKHQAALPKEKISKSEKKKRMEAISKVKEATSSGKKSSLVSSSTTTKSAVKSGVDASAKQREDPGYKGTSRPPQLAYKGTSGLAPRHREGGRDRRRAPKRDEYLGTDEEDEGDFYGDYDDYYSDESSDMEAGLEAMEREELAALRAAEKEDAEDIRREAEAKKAKLERKQKLTAMARARR